ncbi:hypothetical protein HY639_03370 [Candidatus Woesearchaeota archaeon]|nr:hypothetical protein [Candidatus Woesearchaeota archaeon]
MRLFFLLLLLVPSVYAVGVSYTASSLAPLTYRPNGIEERTYYVLSGGEDSAAIAVGGDFAQYAHYDRLVKLTGQRTPFVIRFQFPSKRPAPGIYNADITVFQTQASGGQVALLAGAQIPLYVRVLDPGTYLEMRDFRVEPKHVRFGDTVTFVVPGANYGEKQLKSVKGSIAVFYGDELITTLQTNSQSLFSEQSAELRATWQTKKKKSGEYKAIAKITYDGKETATKETVFYVGEEEVVITNYTRWLTNNSVNPFFVDVTSHWNVPIDFSAGISLIQQDKEVAAFRMPTELLQPWAAKRVIGFVDTRGFALGDYQVNLTLSAGRKQSVYKGTVSVLEGRPDLIIREIEKPAKVPKNVIVSLVAVVLLLFVLNVILLIAYRRKK